MRRLLALLATTALTIVPASAQPAALVFSGSVHVNCFGCDVQSPCQADLTIAGVTHSGGAATTWCYAQEPSGALCLVTGTAYGEVKGTSGSATRLDAVGFFWTRVGTFALITVFGDVTGQGTATFIAPGASCGGPVDATVVGAVAGV